MDGKVYQCISNETPQYNVNYHQPVYDVPDKNEYNFKHILIVALTVFIGTLLFSNFKNKPTVVEERLEDTHQLDCARAADTSIKLIEDGVSYLDYQNNILVEEGCPTISEDDIKWYPGVLSADGTHQQLPELDVHPMQDGSHARFKALASKYGLDASLIWKYEQKYKLTEGMILCIAITETSGGKRGAGENNIGNVGNTDSNPRGQSYDGVEESLDAIGRVLNNQYLGGIQTLACLSNAGDCQARDNNGKRYATSDGNRQRNMVNCLETIYMEDINPARLSFRTTYEPLQQLTVS